MDQADLVRLDLRRVPKTHPPLFVKMMDTELTVVDGLGREKSVDFEPHELPNQRYGRRGHDTVEFQRWQDHWARVVAQDPNFEWRNPPDEAHSCPQP